VYRSGASTTTLSIASSSVTAEVWGVVETANASSFTLISQGELFLSSHGLGDAGNVLYLSEATAGLMTTIEPTNGISKPIGFVIDSNNIHVEPMRGFAVGSSDSTFAFEEYSFTGDGSSVNFDTPTDIANQESVLVVVGGVPQNTDSYNVVGDGNGNPRRIQFTEAPPENVDIWVRYLGVVKTVSTVTPVASTDYNSGTPVPLALSSTTDPANIQASSNFIFNHGLGQTPKDINVILKCLDPDLGYSINDEMSIHSIEATSAGTNGIQAATVSSNSSNVTVSLADDVGGWDAYMTIHKTSQQRGNIDLSKWGVVVYANAEMGGTNGVIQAVNTPATEFESSVVQIATSTATAMNDVAVKDIADFTFAHGLSSTPKSVKLILECLTGNNGYSIGDEINIDGLSSDTNNSPLFTPVVDGTNITVVPKKTGAYLLRLQDKSTGADFTADLAQWGVKVYANSELGGYKGDRGPAGTGKIAQVKYDEVSGQVTISSWFPIDDTIPQKGEGQQEFSIQFTPKNPDSTLLLELSAGGIPVSGGEVVAGFFVDSQNDALVVGNLGKSHTGNDGFDGSIRKFLPANGTNTRTYTVELSGQGTMNYTVNSGDYGGSLSSTFSVTEILP
jgi:hypothetical protein